MFGDFQKFEEMKQKVDSVSPTFCMAKWLHVTMHLLNGHTHSCYLPQTHKVPLSELKTNPSALHNTEHKKEQRKQMLAGQRPSECQMCWAIEDLPGNQVSDRRLRSIDSWTMPHFDRLASMPWNENVNPTYVEVSFSSSCNFKCSYCSPHVSSAWMKEIESQGPYQLSQGAHQDLGWLKNNDMLPLDEESNPYIEAFWQWWPELLKSLEFFRITGGEPLLSRHTFRVLEWLNANPQPKLNLQINSNFGIPEIIFDRFLKQVLELSAGQKVHGVMIHTSLDTYGSQAEYIRNGLNFAQFEKNINRYLTEVPQASIAFMCAFNNLSVVGFKRFLEWVIDLRKKYPANRILLDIPHLTGPIHQAANILTPDYLKQITDLFPWMEQMVGAGALLQPELDKLNRIASWMNVALPEGVLLQARRDFYYFFREHDRRRNTDFLAVFPEMAQFWQTCKELT